MQPIAPRETSRWKVAVVVSVTLFVLGPALYITVAEIQSARRLQAAIDEFKAMGFPLTATELRAMAPAEADNAEPIYRPLIKAFNSSPFKGWNYGVGSGDPLTQSEIADLDASRDWIDQIPMVGSKRIAWFDRNYEDGPLTRLPEFSTMYGLARLSGRQAKLDLRRGAFHKALEKLKAMNAIANHLYRDPSGIGWLTGYRAALNRNRAVIACALETKDLNSRLALRQLLVDDPLKDGMENTFSFDTIDFLSPVTPELAIHYENKLPKQVFLSAPIKNRWRTLRAENHLDWVKTSRGGIEANEYAELSKRYDERQNADPISRIAANEIRPFWLLGIDSYNERYQLAVSALDILIEEAGGPKAKLSSAIRKEKLDGDNWRLQGSSHSLSVVNGKVTSQGL